jgi:hypothetical protein
VFVNEVVRAIFMPKKEEEEEGKNYVKRNCIISAHQICG